MWSEYGNGERKTLRQGWSYFTVFGFVPALTSGVWPFVHNTRKCLLRALRFNYVNEPDVDKRRAWQSGCLQKQLLLEDLRSNLLTSFWRGGEMWTAGKAFGTSFKNVDFLSTSRKAPTLCFKWRHDRLLAHIWQFLIFVYHPLPWQLKRLR